MRSRKQARADDDRRYAPQYVHIPLCLSDVLREDAAGWPRDTSTSEVHSPMLRLGALISHLQ
jgi:hypothetical protein